MNKHRDLPSGWTLAPLRDVATINPTNPTHVPAANTFVSFVPMAAVQELTGRMNASTTRSWSDVKKGFTRFQDGDIVFAKITPSMENGKVALAANLFNGVAAGTTEFHVFRPPPGVINRYLLHYLLQETFRRRARARMTGTAGQLRVPTQFLEEEALPLAPTPEQQRIVEAIDSYLTRLDDAVASLKRVQAKLKAYRASMLKAAVEGRLVPTEACLARIENRAYEPAEVLLGRFLKERRRRWEQAELAKLKAAGKTPNDDKWQAKYEEPVAPDTSRLPTLPEGWCWVSLDQLLAEPLANGKSVPDGSGVPVVRLTCIKSGLVDLTEQKSGDWADIDPRRFFVKADDFLIIRGNGSIDLVGRGGRVSAAPDGVAYPDTLIRARVDPAVLHPPLVARWWDSPPVRQHIERRAKTTAGIYKVNQVDLGQTPVPLAPMLEQTRIYDELERLDTTAIAATATIEAGVRRCSRLRQAVLKWAFEGKLVDQDPTDEPAEKLLARIRAERAAVSPVRKILGRRARGAV